MEGEELSEGREENMEWSEGCNEECGSNGEKRLLAPGVQRSGY